ncbi:unnamed protein product [Caenorhabditis auriculariae]|uniref:Uncharacterized protein n=1 Tax=Caenorhabditis auriculariae TaxID=2777116 RepID=A0A8S1H247_9PELO|nr:unnamed protein product [Caenorhabditis auriculariae]
MEVVGDCFFTSRAHVRFYVKNLPQTVDSGAEEHRSSGGSSSASSGSRRDLPAPVAAFRVPCVLSLGIHPRCPYLAICIT